MRHHFSGLLWPASARCDMGLALHRCRTTSGCHNDATTQLRGCAGSTAPGWAPSWLAAGERHAASSSFQARHDKDRATGASGSCA